MGVSDGRSEEWVSGFNHAMRVMALWVEFQAKLPEDRMVCGPGLTALGMRKSNLLGRLMRGEEVRRCPCPEHKGRQVGYVIVDEPFTCGCDGTGWLPNPTSGADEEEPPRRPWWKVW